MYEFRREKYDRRGREGEGEKERLKRNEEKEQWNG